MFKQAAIILMLLAVPTIVKAQGPLSPPERSPVPMSVGDPEPARKEATVSKLPAEKVATPAATPAVTIQVPVASTSRHISTGNAVFDSFIYEAATVNGLDPCLIVSVMRQESGFNRMAVSPKGASGLMQLMPATAERFGVKNIFDPRENILAGAKYLRWLLDRFNGDVRLALAGYNAGEGAVQIYGNQIPPFLETQNYVRMIYTRYSGLHLGAASTASATIASQPVPVTPRVADPTPEVNPSYNQIIRLTSVSGDAAKGSH
jgi:soluble lytic murein transglycosylase-like protein